MKKRNIRSWIKAGLVILRNEMTKNLGQNKILRCAQDDNGGRKTRKQDTEGQRLVMLRDEVTKKLGLGQNNKPGSYPGEETLGRALASPMI